ncbi:uncharacterized protein EI97DRAFT_435901 [Westerdykella ornata]|uniref:Uncharacterized protein n=1 Tax=Westerdykella ornata TaxID=318751 RepID=A0A6A6JBD1_WESOR|nr:uncharacterized protein EI97DRAFT_435901 [Westerdykella ornata]KAF2273732.1 hypothetical protein EI97DRAFT_435901 [Westerdykella ornata]
MHTTYYNTAWAPSIKFHPLLALLHSHIPPSPEQLLTSQHHDDVSSPLHSQVPPPNSLPAPLLHTNRSRTTLEAQPICTQIRPSTPRHSFQDPIQDSRHRSNSSRISHLAHHPRIRAQRPRTFGEEWVYLILAEILGVCRVYGCEKGGSGGLWCGMHGVQLGWRP